MAFLDRAATDKTLVGGCHFPFPRRWARGARGERLPLAAGRLAVDHLTTTPEGDRCTTRPCSLSLSVQVVADVGVAASRIVPQARVKRKGLIILHHPLAGIVDGAAGCKEPPKVGSASAMA